MSQQVKLTKTERERYIKMIWFYRRHIVLAAKDILGVQLAPHQRIVLKQIWKKKTVMLVMSRGMSKTFIVALASVLYSILYPALRSLIAAGESFRQGCFVMEDADKIITGNNPNVRKVAFARRIFGKYEGNNWRVLNRRQDCYAIECALTTSSIKTFPMSKPDAIRGYRGHKVFLDESNAIPREVIQKVIAPFANVKRQVLEDMPTNFDVENSFVYAGTIEYTWQDFAVSISKLLKVPTDDSVVLEFNYEDAFKYGIDWQFIEKQRDLGENDILTWAAENKNQLKEESETYYGSKLVMRDGVSPIVTYIPKVKKNKCFMGVDPAREADSFAVSIVMEDPKLKLLYPVYQNKWTKTKYSTVVGEIFKLFDKYNIVRIGLDIGGGGHHVRDLLLEPENKMYEPVFDPEDEGAVNLLGADKASISKNILRLIKPNAERNTQWNSYVKGLLQTGHFKFTDKMFAPRLPDKTEEAVMKAMVECKNQFRAIKCKTIGNNNFMTFYLENKRHHKDLYSSIVYALSVYKDYIEVEKKSINIDEPGLGGWL